MTTRKQAEPTTSTEEKIKEAARKVFTQKGYAATRTRDIAEEAGLNLALLNYYFRSKEKLFTIIMSEKMGQLFGVLEPVLNDPASTLEEKVTIIASKYIDLITDNPDLPLFVLSEVRSRPEHLLKLIGNAGSIIKSVFIRQIQERKPKLNPLHFLVNLLGMCVFPFVMRPVLQKMAVLDDKVFAKLMKERKKLIPLWFIALLEME